MYSKNTIVKTFKFYDILLQKKNVLLLDTCYELYQIFSYNKIR
jgi:hypothetical protein